SAAEAPAAPAQAAPTVERQSAFPAPPLLPFASPAFSGALYQASATCRVIRGRKLDILQIDSKNARHSRSLWAGDARKSGAGTYSGASQSRARLEPAARLHGDRAGRQHHPGGRPPLVATAQCEQRAQTARIATCPAPDRASPGTLPSDRSGATALSRMRRALRQHLSPRGHAPRFSGDRRRGDLYRGSEPCRLPLL